MSSSSRSLTTQSASNQGPFPRGNEVFDASSMNYRPSISASTSQRQDRRTNASRTTKSHPRYAPSTIGGLEAQQIVCAISEARGISPTVGIAFINISTGEAILSQICDNQFYARTIHKLQVYEPTEILIASTCAPPHAKSNLYSLIEEHVIGAKLVSLDRGYWSENAGLDYITQLAFKEDIESIKIAIGGNYFATCCLAAAIKYASLALSLTFSFHSVRIRYKPSEDSMMIDLSTIQSLELIQNIQHPKSKACLFGLLNETLTPMGARLLRSNILQPSTLESLLISRYDAVEELQSNQEMFWAVRKALKSFHDVEKLLTTLIIKPTNPDIAIVEQRINNILILKSVAYDVGPIFEALASVRSPLLEDIRKQCRPENIRNVIQSISRVINADVAFQSTPLDLKNQRTYAVKSGLNGLLDVARVTYREATEDVHQHISDLAQKYNLQLETKYENARRFYLKIRKIEFDEQEIPELFINRYRRKGHIECQTLDLVKLNQRIQDSHQEVVMMSDQIIEDLYEAIRVEIPVLFRICECIAMLDMLTAFAQVVTAGNGFCRPDITNAFAVDSGRHAVMEQSQAEKFTPNHVYASETTRFQIITGCNMSGKSTYIRSIALMTVMAQVGCFVPAETASISLIHQLFARISMDDCIEANVSTFAAEMRETAFILRNIDHRSLAIIDELGRGTSTRDGLAIALSIAETLVASKAFVWFATHFLELGQILSERPGVVTFHLAVDMSDRKRMIMLFKLTPGQVQEDHYGLACARLVDMPKGVLETAEKVSIALTDQIAARKRTATFTAIAKKRKLILALHELLKQARDGAMDDEALFEWLKKLQLEFYTRMENIEAETAGEDDNEEDDASENKFDSIEDPHTPVISVMDEL